MWKTSWGEEKSRVKASIQNHSIYKRYNKRSLKLIILCNSDIPKKGELQFSARNTVQKVANNQNNCKTDNLANHWTKLNLAQLSVCSLNLLIVLLTVTALAVFNVYAPPAFTFPQSLQPQIPTAFLFTAYFPQNSQKYLLCWLTSIFLICFRKLAPYLVPRHQQKINNSSDLTKWNIGLDNYRCNYVQFQLYLHINQQTRPIITSFKGTRIYSPNEQMLVEIKIRLHQHLTAFNFG